MSGVLRSGVWRMMKTSSASKVSTELLLRNAVPAVQQACAISGKALRNLEQTKRPAPYDYLNKDYNVFHAFLDKTTHRFDENSKVLKINHCDSSEFFKHIFFKVIVVEGPVAAGKSKFAKELANDLDMLYVPEANLDLIYINKYGYDLRKLDDQLPATCKSFDVNNFLKTPNHRSVATFQMQMYQLR